MDVNLKLRELADEIREEQVAALYDQMMEDMYGSNPFWNGTGDDWDWNDGLIHWEKK